MIPLRQKASNASITNRQGANIDQDFCYMCFATCASSEPCCPPQKRGKVLQMSRHLPRVLRPSLTILLATQRRAKASLKDAGDKKSRRMGSDAVRNTRTAPPDRLSIQRDWKREPCARLVQRSTLKDAMDLPSCSESSIVAMANTRRRSLRQWDPSRSHEVNRGTPPSGFSRHSSGRGLRLSRFGVVEKPLTYARRLETIDHGLS